MNLGKGKEGLQGVCEQCGGEVRWRGHEQVQSWIQCDACGRWRTVPDTVLRQVHMQVHLLLHPLVIRIMEMEVGKKGPTCLFGPTHTVVYRLSLLCQVTNL